MDLSGEQRGVLIQQVFQDSPADLAGLRGSFSSVVIDGERVLVGGDIITALDGTPIKDLEGLQAGLRHFRAGDVVNLEVIREGRSQDIRVTLGERPEI